MNRRAFLCGLTGTLAVPFAAGAQPAGKVWRIGVLVPAEPAISATPRVKISSSSTDTLTARLIFTPSWSPS